MCGFSTVGGLVPLNLSLFKGQLYAPIDMYIYLCVCVYVYYICCI